MPDIAQRLMTAAEAKQFCEAENAIMAAIAGLSPALAMSVLSCVVGRALEQITPDIADLPRRLDSLRNCVIEVYVTERMAGLGAPSDSSYASH